MLGIAHHANLARAQTGREPLVVRGASLFRNGTRLAAGHAFTEDELEDTLVVGTEPAEGSPAP